MNVIVVGGQWGDEGKGKIADVLTEQAYAVVRYNGGNNAGHTIKVGDDIYKFHHIASGIVHDKLSVLGPGMVLNEAASPTVVEEIAALKGKKDISKICISPYAHVVGQHHVQADKERSQKSVGTTARGIGPAYASKMNRTGVRVCDLRNDTFLREQLQKDLAFHQVSINLEELLLRYLDFGKQLAPFITDTSKLLQQLMNEEKPIVFEGAQGTFLDIDHGTYPCVTSSNTTAGHAETGSGVRIRKAHRLGIVKAYTTRVGKGPFPSELHDHVGEHIRQKGQEYGTTTGRPRRCGWLDTVLLRKTVQVNGLDSIALTKLDVLDELDYVVVVSSYQYEGQNIETLPASTCAMDKLKMNYHVMKGWQTSLQDASFEKREELPVQAQQYISFIEQEIGVPVSILSYGQDRTQTLQFIDPFAAQPQ